MIKNMEMSFGILFSIVEPPQNALNCLFMHSVLPPALAVAACFHAMATEIAPVCV